MPPGLGKFGALGLLRRGDGPLARWERCRIGGADGIEHDLVGLIDLDGDGDVDVLTCEEARKLESSGTRTHRSTLEWK